MLRPRSSDLSIVNMKKPGDESSSLKKEDAGDLSVKDMLAQAKRREAAAQHEQGAVTTGKGRKSQIITDVDQSRMHASFLAETTDDIDLDGNEAVSITNRNDDRCFPVRLPFSQDANINQTAAAKKVSLTHDIMLVQLPSLFPTLVTESTPSVAQRRVGKNHSSTSSPTKPRPKIVGTPFAEIPDGRIGTLKIHKSGKHVLHVGETQFVVKEGQKVNFRTEVACVCPGENEIIFLGQAETRLVVSPVIHS